MSASKDKGFLRYVAANYPELKDGAEQVLSTLSVWRMMPVRVRNTLFGVAVLVGIVIGAVLF